jgi:hypothetical protein
MAKDKIHYECSKCSYQHRGKIIYRCPICFSYNTFIKKISINVLPVLKHSDAPYIDSNVPYQKNKKSSENSSVSVSTNMFEEYKTQKDMFIDLWFNLCVMGDKRSELSGRKLSHFYNTDMWYSCFAHILRKGKYTYFKLYSKNILIVHPEEHHLIDNGTKLQKIQYEKKHNCSFDVFYQKQEYLLSEYNKHFK